MTTLNNKGRNETEPLGAEEAAKRSGERSSQPLARGTGVLVASSRRRAAGRTCRCAPLPWLSLAPAGLGLALPEWPRLCLSSILGGQGVDSCGGSVPIPDLGQSGLLPFGRYRCSMSEVRDRFVLHPDFACSTTRKVIWQHWLQAKDTLKSLVPVHAAWLGGSFTTAKLDPDDLDVVFVVNGAATNAITNPAARQALVLFAASGLRALRGWRLDTFVLEWVPIAQPGELRDVVDEEYYSWRGHWDDFWQRQRTGGKNDPITPADAVPRRGYLEVRFSEYTV